MYFILAIIFIIVSSFAIAEPEVLTAQPSVESQSVIDQQVSTILTQEETCFQTAQSNVDMRECSSSKLKSADKLLNQVYQDRVSSLKQRAEMEKASDELFKTAEETLKRLIIAQKSWIGFRDADCKLQGAELLHGSGEGLIIQGCLADKTLKRVKDIAPTEMNQVLLMP